MAFAVGARNGRLQVLFPIPQVATSIAPFNRLNSHSDTLVQGLSAIVQVI